MGGIRVYRSLFWAVPILDDRDYEPVWDLFYAVPY
jgi:hypothetical protein